METRGGEPSRRVVGSAGSPGRPGPDPSGARPGRRITSRALRCSRLTLTRLPSAVAYGIADAAAPLLLAGALRRERRLEALGRGMLRNQRIAFRDGLTPTLSRRLMRGWARHMCRLVVDVCRLPRIDARNLARHVDASALAPIARCTASGRGVICVTGHIGHWELLAHAAGLVGIPLTAVVRELPPAPLGALLAEIRSRAAFRVVPQRGALWRLRKCIGRGEAVGLLADEDVPRDPIFVPFLGTLAASSRAPAALQRATGAPIAVLSCHRVGRERFRVDLWRWIEPPPADAGPQAVTVAIADALSQAIRAHPEQWLWGSRRFRTRPDGEAPTEDGLPPRVVTPRAGAARMAAPRGAEGDLA